jgi:16S rRNA (cytosine967-C5)-methyltransferase
LSEGVTPGRRAALEVLRAVRGGAFADHALTAALVRVPVRERAWLQELVYGTLRLRGRLDHLLAQLSKRSLDALDADVLDVLRLGAYQLEAMDSVPAYAAVSQSVELGKTLRARGAHGFINGVLQNLRRQRAGLTFPDGAADPVAYLTAWGSHPRWLVERWVHRFGAEAAGRLIEANNRRPELYLRTVGISAEEAVARLAAAELPAERVPFAPDSLRLHDAARLVDAFRAAPVVVQDPAAALVTRAAAAPADALVADLCAAPGGKALGLAATAGYVVAADLSMNRVARLRENAHRLAPLPVGVVVADARRPPLRSADVVLLDAPCSGTGTFRRHPDGRWRVNGTTLGAVVALQAELLQAAAHIVAAGGVLIYSTCSLEPEENEHQVEAFLETNPEFTAEPVTGIAAEAVDAAGRLYVLPQVLGVDGAFAARLRRVA